MMEDGSVTSPSGRKFRKAFILHLARAEGRKPNVERLLTGLNAHFDVPVDVFLAIDAKDPDRMRRSGYEPKLLRPYYPFQLRQSEIAIFLSYRAMLKMISGLDDGYYFIVEDDARIDYDRFSAVVAELEASDFFDFVRCPIKKRDIRNPISPRRGGLYRPLRIGAGMVGQFVTPEGARKIYAATERFDRPIDGFMQLGWHHRLNVAVYDGCGISEISEDLGGTLAHSRSPLWTAFFKEIRRVHYRTMILLLSLGWAMK